MRGEPGRPNGGDGRDFELLEPNAKGLRVFALTDQASVSFEYEGTGLAQQMSFHQSGMTIELEREDSGN